MCARCIMKVHTHTYMFDEFATCSSYVQYGLWKGSLARNCYALSLSLRYAIYCNMYHTHTVLILLSQTVPPSGGHMSLPHWHLLLYQGVI